MTYWTAVPRLALWKVATGLGAVAAASLAFAGVASASIITVNPDGTSGSNNLASAITTANTNGQSSNIIVLNSGRYFPPVHLPTITNAVTITANHALQATGGVPATEVDGSQQASTDSAFDLLTIATGVNVEMDGFQFVGSGASNQAVIRDNGHLTMNNMAITGGSGTPVAVPANASAILTDVTIDGSSASADITNSGTLTLNNSTLADGAGEGIGNSSPGTFTLNNSLLALQTGLECTGGVSQNGGPGSLDDDGSCGVQHSSDTSVDITGLTPSTHGGPTSTDQWPQGSTTLTGQSSLCPITDQRFFVNPVVMGARECDIGAQTGSSSTPANTAARDTTLPTCVVTRTQYPPAVPVAQQDVTVTDTGSGMGPEAGSATDLQPSGTINPADAITNLTITDGSVAFTPFTMPSTNGLVLTATKGSDPTVGATHWSFSAADWAGNTKACS
jgi:hypothetical protein